MNRPDQEEQRQQEERERQEQAREQERMNSPRGQQFGDDNETSTSPVIINH
ncbi:MAG: hypothetical protein ABI588_01835 [Arenimonas sp.]